MAPTVSRWATPHTQASHLIECASDLLASEFMCEARTWASRVTQSPASRMMCHPQAASVVASNLLGERACKYLGTKYKRTDALSLTAMMHRKQHRNAVRSHCLHTVWCCTALDVFIIDPTNAKAKQVDIKQGRITSVLERLQACARMFHWCHTRSPQKDEDYTRRSFGSCTRPQRGPRLVRFEPTI